MSYDEDAVLLTVKQVKYGSDCIPTEMLERTEVYAGRKSTTRTEAYKAMREGLSTVITLGLQTSEYEAAILDVEGKKVVPTYVEYDGRKYRIARTYGEDTEEMELILEES